MDIESIPIPPTAPALRPQSRPVKKQMVTILHAASFCLSTASDKSGVVKALEVLSRLCDADLTHAKAWLGGTGPIAAEMAMESVDKLLLLIESIERARPKLQAVAAAAKVRAALAGIAGTAAHDDPAKLKAQTEN